MKRFIFIAISFVFLASMLLSGCGNVDRYKELSQLQESNEEKFESVFTEETCDYDMFSEYMNSWAKSSKVDVVSSGKHSTVLFNPATDGCSGEPSTALLCNIETSDVQSSLKTLSTAATSLLGPEKHGDIYLIITEIRDGQFAGISEVPDRYLAVDNLINLQTSSSNTILTSGPRNASCTFRKSGNATEPHYSQAYKITFTMAEYTDPYDFVKSSNYPNPVDTVGGLLATAKSSGKLFDIASFTCKSHDGYTPYSATAVVVIDGNNVESFTKKFENSYDNVADKFEDLEDDFVYAMNETDLPETVLSDRVSNNLVSLMYTLNTGICLQDEDTGIINASSYIKDISTENGDLELDLDMRTRGESYLDSISTEYATTAGLCSTKYSCRKNGLLWDSVDDSKLVTYFTEAVPLMDGDSSISLRKYENDEIHKRFPDVNMIIYTFESGDRKTVLDNIAHYLSAE